MGLTLSWLSLAVVAVCFTVVVQRYVFHTTQLWMQDLYVWLAGAMFTGVAGFALLNDSHVRVDIFYSKASERGKAWIDLIGTYLTLMPMSALILWASTGYMNSTWRILERSRESDGLPFVFLLKTAIPLFAIMMIMQGLSMACRSALTIAGKEAPPTPKNASEAEI